MSTRTFLSRNKLVSILSGWKKNHLIWSCVYFELFEALYTVCTRREDSDYPVPLHCLVTHLIYFFSHDCLPWIFEYWETIASYHTYSKIWIRRICHLFMCLKIRKKKKKKKKKKRGCRMRSKQCRPWSTLCGIIWLCTVFSDLSVQKFGAVLKQISWILFCGSRKVLF